MTVSATNTAPTDALAASSAASRRAMVDSQLRTSGVNAEFVLERMLLVPRENHVPEHAQGTAYIDRAITLENGRKIAAPLFYGMLLEEAQPKPSDTVLVVDAGSGYLPALVRPLAGQVDVIAPEEAVTSSRKRTAYSLVLVDGAVESVGQPLAKRMAADGRIVTGISKQGVTRLATGRKAGDDVALLPLAEIGIPRLSEFDTEKSWSF